MNCDGGHSEEEASWQPKLPLRDRHGDSRVEVRVYRFGLLKICEWCDSEEDAAALVDMWCVKDGTRCEVHRRSA